MQGCVSFRPANICLHSVSAEVCNTHGQWGHLACPLLLILMHLVTCHSKAFWRIPSIFIIYH